MYWLFGQNLFASVLFSSKFSGGAARFLGSSDSCIVEEDSEDILKTQLSCAILQTVLCVFVS
jgi:hypothetical protein